MIRILALVMMFPLWGWAQPQEGVKEDTPAEVFPRNASLKRGEVNVRSGPGSQYPILWVYWRAGYPVELLARFDNYLKIRDMEGEEGWVHQAMVGKRITGLVAGRVPANLYKHADGESRIKARLAPGVVVALKNPPCTGVYCEVDVVPEGEEGFVRTDVLEFPGEM